MFVAGLRHIKGIIDGEAFSSTDVALGVVVSIFVGLIVFQCMVEEHLKLMISTALTATATS